MGKSRWGAAYHCSGPPAPPQLGITPRICDEEATATAQGDEDALRLLSSMAMRRFHRILPGRLPGELLEGLREMSTMSAGPVDA